MSASPLWVSLLSPALSFLAVAVNVWITFRNWQRRPAAHWICIPVHGKEERIDFNRFLKDADDDLAKSDGIGHMFALTNNGEMQAESNCSPWTARYRRSNTWTRHMARQKTSAPNSRSWNRVEPSTHCSMIRNPNCSWMASPRQKAVGSVSTGWIRRPVSLNTSSRISGGTSLTGNVSLTVSSHSANHVRCPRMNMMPANRLLMNSRYMVLSNPLEENAWLVFCCVVSC